MLRSEQLVLGVGARERRDRVEAAQQLARRLLPGQEERRVVDPVLVARRLVDDALLAHHLHEAAGEGADRAAEQEGHGDEAVLRRVDELERQAAEVHAAGEALRLDIVPAVGEHCRLRRHHRRGLRGDIDVLADAVALARGVRDQRADSGLGAGVQVRLRDRN